jgi:hypothetical protein
MTEPTPPAPCTREEALRILRTKVAVGVEPVPAPADLARYVARLQTLPDADLSVLTQSEDTFALVETNRRFLVALQQEAARTTDLTLQVVRLTRWVLGLTGLLVVLTLALILHH